MSTVHVSIQDLIGHVDDVLQRVRSGDRVIIDSEKDAFQITPLASPADVAEADVSDEVPASSLRPFHIRRTDFRPLSVILQDPNKVWSNALLDDQWERDVEEGRAAARSHERDVWQE